MVRMPHAGCQSSGWCSETDKQIFVPTSKRPLGVSSAIEGGLMPSVPTDVAGLDFFGWYQSAERTSGDFYDFVKTRGGGIAAVVGDVAAGEVPRV